MLRYSTLIIVALLALATAALAIVTASAWLIGSCVSFSLLTLLPAHKCVKPMRLEIGGPQCQQPYSASMLNISATSFGALSAQAIRALNLGAERGSFAHDTGQGGLTPYHLEHGGDIIWALGTGYFGCRTPAGQLDPELFRQKSALAQIRIIEIKLSQGAKPSHGGVLPGPKVTQLAIAGNFWPCAKQCWKRPSIRISSSSTANKAAPAPRRWS